MKHGIWIDNQNFLPASQLVELAQSIEKAGWTGIFLSDSPGWEDGYMDPIVLLAAIASKTDTIKLGTWIIPAPLHQPQDLAMQLATLDELSGGRVIFGAGSGGGPDYAVVGLPSDIKTRAAMLDESLDIIDLLWQGEKVNYKGEYYTIDGLQLKTTPIQKPRIPIIIAGTWPAKKPFQRGGRWDGMMPNPVAETDQMMEMVKYFRKQGTGRMFVALNYKKLDDDKWMTIIEDLGIEWIIVTGLVRKDQKTEELIIEHKLIESIPKKV